MPLLRDLVHCAQPLGLVLCKLRQVVRVSVDLDATVALLNKLNSRRAIYRSASGIEVTATPTAKFSPHDYAVGLVIPGRAEFYPTHVRLLIDLHLKRISNPKDARLLFCVFERVFDGEDPDKYKEAIGGLRFPMQLDDADVSLYYSQLLMIEQDFNFGPDGEKQSRLSPPREFLMRFIRWVYSQDNEIDKVITSAVRNYPPPTKYGKRIECSGVLS